MKNLITITSILAAGTLCANAAVNLGDAWISSLSAASSNVILKNFAVSSYKVFNGDVGTSLTGLGIYSDTNGFLMTNGVVYSRSGNDSNLNTDFVAVSSGTLSMGNKTGSNGTLAYVANQISAEDLSTATSLALTFSVSGLSSSQALSISVIYGNGTSGWTLVGNEYATTTNGTHTITLSSDATYSATDEFIVVFGTGTDATGKQNTWCNVTGENDSPAPVVISGLKMIPEPSMFGLLAGTLALGLAGTRRRRGK